MMKFSEILKIEFMKVRRSKIIPLIFIAPLLVVVSGVVNLSMYFTPEYTDVWQAMFIQSALLYSYYLLPLSMVVVCVMISNKEVQNNGILKMLSLPVRREMLSVAKFCVLLFYLFMEMAVFLVVFVVAGCIATFTSGINETLPILSLLKWCSGIFITMIPSLAVMWAVTILFEKMLISVGINLLFTIFGLLMGATPVWYLYPYCYSGYLVSCSLHKFTTNGIDSSFQMIPFLIGAILITGVAFTLFIKRFGKIAMK